MPLYQMLCITKHYNDYTHIKTLVQQAATHVMNAGGVVRNINSLGTLTLPQRMKRHAEICSQGDYWTMHFDTAPRTLRSLNSIMRRDPRVLRWTVLKLASKVEDVAKEGKVLNKTESESIQHLTS